MEDKLRLLEYRELLLRYYNERVELGSLKKDENVLDGIECLNDQKVFDGLKDVVLGNVDREMGKVQEREGGGKNGLWNEEVCLLREENLVLREINKQLKAMIEWKNEELRGNQNVCGVSCKDSEHHERSELNVFNLEFRNIPKYPQREFPKTKGFESPKKFPESEEISKKFSQTIKSVKFEFVNRKSNKVDNSRLSKVGKSNTNSKASSPEKLSHCRSNSNLI